MKKPQTFTFHKLSFAEKQFIFKKFGPRSIPSIRAGSSICTRMNASYGDVLLFHYSSLERKKYLSGYDVGNYLKVIL